jgi:hypothetical protein
VADRKRHLQRKLFPEGVTHDPRPGYRPRTATTGLGFNGTGAPKDAESAMVALRSGDTNSLASLRQWDALRQAWAA